ncbi:MAG: spermidine/putrescine ABC transporter substrate-binding protein [Rhodoluna sp.]|nr:spermidine/putrescine ABC transporter substrate-binding protein [Rhodoluna sp.]
MDAKQITRRSLFAGAGALSITAVLAACAPGATKTVYWDNWPYYMDGEADGSFPTLKDFEAKTGIHVEYATKVDDNNTYFASIKNQLAAGTDTGADTFCLTDWMVGRLIGDNDLAKLDYKNLPNVTANLDPAFKGAGSFGDFDPERAYSLPWKGIIAAVGYHKANYKKITGKDAPATLEDLWAPELKGKVEVLSEMRDTLGIIMMANGVDISKFTKADFDAALALFKSKVDSGHIRGVKGNSYIDDYVNGDAVAGIVWAGDLIATNTEAGNEDLGYVLLDTGSTFATDNFVIPKGAKNKALAEQLINYYFDPEVVAKSSIGGVFYVPPVAGVKEIVAKTNPELAANEMLFPSAETFATKLRHFRTLTAEEDNTFSQAWSDVSNGVV